jgi:hypothetical protein
MAGVAALRPASGFLEAETSTSKQFASGRERVLVGAEARHRHALELAGARSRAHELQAVTGIDVKVVAEGAGAKHRAP